MSKKLACGDFSAKTPFSLRFARGRGNAQESLAIGHAKSQLTMDIYIKQDSEGMRIASEYLENFLERGVPNVRAFVPNPEAA